MNNKSKIFIVALVIITNVFLLWSTIDMYLKESGEVWLFGFLTGFVIVCSVLGIAAACKACSKIISPTKGDEVTCGVSGEKYHVTHVDN